MGPSGLIPLVLGELEDDKVLVAWEVPLPAVLLLLRELRGLLWWMIGLRLMIINLLLTVHQCLIIFKLINF